MKHILNKSTYFLFSIIAPIVYLLTCKLGGVGVKGFLLSTGFIELFIWFIFLMKFLQHLNDTNTHITKDYKITITKMN